MQVLGTPTREEIKCMNPNYTEFKFPQIKAYPWYKVRVLLLHIWFLYFLTTYQMVNSSTLMDSQIFNKRVPPEAVDLVSRLLQYSPNLRSTAVSSKLRTSCIYIFFSCFSSFPFVSCFYFFLSTRIKLCILNPCFIKFTSTFSACVEGVDWVCFSKMATYSK